MLVTINWESVIRSLLIAFLTGGIYAVQTVVSGYDLGPVVGTMVLAIINFALAQVQKLVPPVTDQAKAAHAAAKEVALGAATPPS